MGERAKYCSDSLFPKEGIPICDGSESLFKKQATELRATGAIRSWAYKGEKQWKTVKKLWKLRIFESESLVFWEQKSESRSFLFLKSNESNSLTSALL